MIGNCIVDRTRRFMAGILMVSFINGAVGAAEPAQGGGTVTFLQAPEGARTVKFRLAVSENPGGAPPGYLVQRSPQPIDVTASVPSSIANVYAGKEFAPFEIAVLPNGTRYLALLNEDKALKFLNRNDALPCYARIYKVTGGNDSKAELLREGFQAPGNDVTWPVEIEIPGIGATHVKTLRTEFGYNFNGYQNGKPQVYSGRGAGIQVVGSQVASEGKLTMTLQVPEDLMASSETQVTLRFEPLTPGLPERMASGKVSDFLTLGAARFVITEIAADFSSATVAVVAGNLEQTLKQQLQVGAKMPLFSQVELVTRKICTREEVLARARNAGGVVFIFGDLAPLGNRFGPGYGGPFGGPPVSVLPIPPADVVDQLGLERKARPVVVFVTRQIGIDFLYQELRNKTPDYLILTDYTDVLRTAFRMSAGPGNPYYGSPNPPGAESTLRQLFNLPEKLAIAAFDATGKVVYVKADAGAEFLPSIAEARAALPQ